ncbi:MAG TPA: restriction endonuclease [Burkholderiales bacterium]|nr:restriction endonuclease [Burkholderiales bacterium]
MAKKETLFHILSRQPWWVTLLVAFVLYWVAYAIFPPVAPFMVVPFLILAGYIAFIQWRKGAPGNVEERLAELREMPWDTFSHCATDAYRKQGYTVLPSEGRGYDFKLVRDGRTTLLQCRRWKVNQVGEGPLRELALAVEQAGAARGICLSAGAFSAPAKRFAAGEPLTLVSGEDLTDLVRAPKKARK